MSQKKQKKINLLLTYKRIGASIIDVKEIFFRKKARNEY